MKPSAKFDEAIVELCKAINEFPGVATSDSCQGFIDNHRPGEPWSVYFAPQPSPPSRQGYAALEFLVYLCGSEAHAAGFDVRVGLNAPLPLHAPGECLYFFIKGYDRHPENSRLSCVKCATVVLHCRMERMMQHNHPDYYRKDDPDRQFVQSRLWRERLRPLHLARHPLCEFCLAIGLITEAAHVDHIQRPRGDRRLQTAWDNMQSLCADHHNKKSSWERRNDAGRGRPLVLGVNISGEKIIAPRGELKHLRVASLINRRDRSKKG
jgi:5-methylcytosine-specific restriction endonuclease McrA